MAGNSNSGRRRGRPAKPVEEHIADGTFRPHRHAHLLEGAGTFNPPKKPTGRVVATERSQRHYCRNDADERALRAGYRFNEGLAEHVAECFQKYLRHSKGQWAGKPFELTDWQRDELISPLFGWVRPDGTRRFRRSYIEIPKKNYKSTTAAAIGIYGEVFDEEAGAEVFSLGADKDQARVVHSEAINMVEASEHLAELMNINRTTGAITYPATNSFYKALSATPRGKHGLNIHFAIADELHEWWGDELWNSIRYGFRARRQPLFLVITNAGDNLDSICRKQHDKARGILNGTIEDHQFFALICSATKDEAMAELQAVKEGATDLPIAAKCNPGYGHVIQPEDLLQDLRDAIDTPSEVPNLLRLTYSVWSVGSQPWLNIAKWNAAKDDCGKLSWNGSRWDYTPGAVDLSGRECWAGLDLSKNHDLTALTLVFPNEDRSEFWQLPLFWLPEATAESRVTLADYQAWADAGHIRLIPGDSISYDLVESDIVGLQEWFQFGEILYDPWQAEPMRQRLEDVHGIPCVKFEQSLRNFASPTEDYEKLINSGMLHHPGNAVLTWQAGHVECKSDINQNKRPAKRKAGDYRTIDGIVAGVMGLFGAMSGVSGPQGSYYDENALEVA